MSWYFYHRIQTLLKEVCQVATLQWRCIPLKTLWFWRVFRTCFKSSRYEETHYEGTIDQRISFFLTCAIFVHLSFFNKSFIIFLFFHFSCPVPIHLLALSYPLGLPVTFLLFSNVNPTKKSYFSWEELTVFIIANQLCEGWWWIIRICEKWSK